jgi:hypothetical protein
LPSFLLEILGEAKEKTKKKNLKAKYLHHFETRSPQNGNKMSEKACTSF